MVFMRDSEKKISLRVSKSALTLLVLFLIAGSLSSCSNCLFANGEGYCGNRPKASSAPDPIDVSTNGTFYQLESNFTCTDPASGVSIPSYRDAIRREGAGYTSLGTLCAPTSVALDGANFEFSSNGIYLGHGSAIYEFRQNLPTYEGEGYFTEAWCRGGTDTRDIYVRRNYSNSDYYAQLLRPQSTGTETFAVTRGTHSSGDRQYSGTALSLRINPVEDAPLSGRYSGALDYSPLVGETLRCRLLP